jgi:hypothetical protein
MARINLTDPPKRIECRLAGVNYRQGALRRLPKTTKAALVREPQNSHDPNAIAVYVNGRHVGYVPHDDAQWISSVMEHGEWTYVCPHMRVGWWDEGEIYTASIILERRRPNPDLIGSEHLPKPPLAIRCLSLSWTLAKTSAKGIAYLIGKVRSKGD